MSGLSFILVTIPGNQLRDMFERSVSGFDEEGNDQTGAFLQVSGMQLHFDLTQDIGSRLVHASLFFTCEKREDWTIDADYTLVINSMENARDDNNIINAVTAIHEF